ncbi:MAG: hypothetical protein WKG01_28840 [Kofleriaceae bacterium]
MYRSLSLALTLALGSVTAAACGTTEAAPSQNTASAKPAPASSDVHALCVEMLTRNRTCTDDYLPALVDLRAKHDNPAGIAARVTTDRAGVIAEARTEWQTDSTDEAIAAVCTKAAPSTDPADVEPARACLAEATCGAYVACSMPLFEKRFAN